MVHRWVRLEVLGVARVSVWLPWLAVELFHHHRVLGWWEDVGHRELGHLGASVGHWRPMHVCLVVLLAFSLGDVVVLVDFLGVSRVHRMLWYLICLLLSSCRSNRLKWMDKLMILLLLLSLL